MISKLCGQIRIGIRINTYFQETRTCSSTVSALMDFCDGRCAGDGQKDLPHHPAVELEVAVVAT